MYGVLSVSKGTKYFKEPLKRLAYKSKNTENEVPDEFKRYFLPRRVYRTIKQSRGALKGDDVAAGKRQRRSVAMATSGGLSLVDTAGPCPADQ